MDRSPTLLCILDGVGLNPSNEGNAVTAAHTPTLDMLLARYPNSTLTTHGPAVGLPEGQMGNSEVGHLNIGAGRVVKQWLLRIGDAFKDDEVSALQAFQDFNKRIKKVGGDIHLLGLCSFGGVHSHLNHLFSLMQSLEDEVPQHGFVLHLIADGRDVAPQQFLEDIDAIEKVCSSLKSRVTVGSLSGRYYAMDRDNRWERVEKAYNAIQGNSPNELTTKFDGFAAVREIVKEQYSKGITDEFITPCTISPHPINPGDGLICWNFRSDRMRQIVHAIADTDFTHFSRNHKCLDSDQVLCFAQYDRTFPYAVLFPPQSLKDHLGELVSQAGLTQLRIAETEKYPHVTYFFNGGTEEELPGEDRILIPSPRDVKTYDEKPEMSALEVTERVVADIEAKGHDLIVLNFANGDMVGHTGVFDAAVKAVETVDGCLGRILEALKGTHGTALIIADHGNAEMMVDPETGNPHTAHTTFPVPVILFQNGKSSVSLRKDGALCDVAPTILEVMGLPQPSAMTGKSLIFQP
ncbi:MAG: 2,3-bisphosphoglycerate-independent phosphoglycerate mutase [Bdellovibrionales bacterium]|nr:2,3-bisphosphoglycerate-independent phosphoglycerate mutase [Bdellovibrionales bacterium]